MILWTIQELAAWEKLQRDGLLRSDGRRIPRYCRYAYQWMADQMRLRLHAPHGRFPLWGWYRWQGKEHIKPDLRTSGYLTKDTSGVRIEFAIPESKVLLSDVDVLHCVLNGWFLSLCEKEDKDFTEELERAGIQQRWPYSEPFNSQVISSWQHIFNLEAGDTEWRGPLYERSVQANFW